MNHLSDSANWLIKLAQTIIRLKRLWLITKVDIKKIKNIFANLQEDQFIVRALIQILYRKRKYLQNQLWQGLKKQSIRNSIQC